VLLLVRIARRRFLHNELFREGANALSAALLAFILLLVLGTQVLSWYWLTLIPAAAAAAALYRIYRRLPSPYAVARKIDRRMELADTLSTALFFDTGDPSLHISPEFRRLQRAEAERLAQGIDVRKAVPYAVPQTAYIAAALLLIATSVFALRYGLSERLDLRQPLARMLQQRLGLGEQEQRARLDPHRSDKGMDQMPAPEDGEQASPLDDPNQIPQDAAENYAGDQPQAAGAKSDRNSKNQEQLEPDSNQDQAEQAEDASSEGKQNSANPKDSQKNGKESQSGSNSSNSNQSLLSRMKDAMQNLLSSMQQPNQQQNASNQNSKSGKGQQNQNTQQAQKGEKKNAQMNQSQEQQAADEGDQGQNAQSQAADKADSPLANKQPGSGAGNKDGSKDLKQAEQLAAMGKISEIIGKRAANVTGEVTVDVQNTSQQLRTGYQDRRAEHTQAGAEINRDEIPVALESYVEHYFEQVRKQPGKK